MTTADIAPQQPQLWVIDKHYVRHDPESTPQVTCADEGLANEIAGALSAQDRSADYSVYSLPFVKDIDSARVERLTLRQTPSFEGVVYESSEKLEVEWTFTDRFAFVPVEDRSTAKQIMVTGHDHAQVRALFADLVEQRVAASQ